MEIIKLKQIIFSHLIGNGKVHYRQLNNRQFGYKIVGPYEITGITIDAMDRFSDIYKEIESVNDFIEVNAVKNITEDHAKKLMFQSVSDFQKYFSCFGFGRMSPSILNGLLCLGYAVPFMGYRVHELVSMGIYKFKV